MSHKFRRPQEGRKARHRHAVVLHGYPERIELTRVVLNDLDRRRTVTFDCVETRKKFTFYCDQRTTLSSSSECRDRHSHANDVAVGLPVWLLYPSGEQRVCTRVG